MAMTLGVVLRWLAADQDDGMRRIHDAVGVDPIHFESGYPKAGLTPRWRSKRPPARGGRARRRSAMLRRMRVTMLLADAASVADGTLDILGGGWNINRRRAWHDQACAELEARLAQARVPREGIAAKRWGGA